MCRSHGTSNKIEYLLETSGVMKWKSTVENFCLLGAIVIGLKLKELPRSRPTKRISGMRVRTNCALLNEYHMWSLALFPQSVCVCECLYVCVCLCECADVCTRHTLTCSVLNQFFCSHG